MQFFLLKKRLENNKNETKQQNMICGMSLQLQQHPLLIVLLV